MVMNMQKLETLPPPPGVFDSLRAGFEVVSNRIMLILIPLCLDLLFWLGPRLSVDGLLSPYFRLAFAQARRAVAEADLERFIQAQSLLMEWLRDFNLLSLLSKSPLFPLGVSSLSAQTLPVKNPLGLSDVVAVPSFGVALGLALVLVPFGWILGGAYYRQVAGSILGGDEAMISFPRAAVQSILLSLVWLVGLGAVGVPLFMVLGLFVVISPALANVVLFVLLLFSFWLIVPLFFTPHGIFVRDQNAFLSILSSVRMVRFSLPTSSMFVLSVFLLSYGLDLLWSAPGEESWLALVGFTGHAFMTTVLLAASFVYYRNVTDWMKKIHG